MQIFQNLWERETRLSYVPLDLQCIYGCSDDGGENRDGEDGNEISGRGKRVDITWPLICR